MNNFEEITKNPETLGAFLRGLPVIEAPWDEEFQRKYCAGCGKVSCDDTVRSETLKGITTVYAITRQNVRAETTIKVRTQSSDGGIVGTVLFAGHKIPLYRFNVSPTIPIQRATVSAAVLAGNGRTPFQDAFIARMQSGHTGMFERDGSKRLPISEFMGPSTAQMAGNSIVLADVEEKAQEVINKRVEHEITRILNGYGG